MIQQLEKTQLIKEFRQRATQNDSQDLQEKRKKWLKFLAVNFLNPNINFLEMYKTPEGEVIKGKPGDFQYPSKWINTRTKILSETRAEIDKLPFEKAFDVCLEIIKILMAKGLHFAVWYAEGQRSPHIVIYDFDDLKILTTKERYKAQLEFWKSIIPFFMQHLDYSVWVDGQLMPLEFGIHYRTGTPFNLILEWIPEQKGSDYQMFFDGSIKFDPDRKKGKLKFGFILKMGTEEITAQIGEGYGTTPEAEYQGLILGLKEIQKRKLQNVKIFGDSQLICNQINGSYGVDSETLKPFHQEAKALMESHTINWIPREQNVEADKILKQKKIVEESKTIIKKENLCCGREKFLLKILGNTQTFCCGICGKQEVVLCNT